MEKIKAYFTQYYHNKGEMISVAAIDNPYPYHPLMNGFDLLILVVAKRLDRDRMNEHVLMDGVRIQLKTIDPIQLERWLTCGEDRSIIQWLVRGEILLDQGDYLAQIRHRLIEFPEALREQKRLIEFSNFLRTYLQAKQDMQDNNLLDAHSNILTALHHWAHIALIEEGIHPELTVWRQVQRIFPEIYKLYDELTNSPETLEQRVQLVLLGCEFTVMSKMKSCCSLLLQVLSSREEPWSVMELSHHPALSGLQIDLSLLLQKLVKRAYIREVVVMPSIAADSEVLELKYRPTAD
ncbi:nucleotidyltransferase-like protein [Paenibacillus abyssi]|uniref:Nucleotidyltransferase-like domain-containing protein n=1 Tax=Paenibacillus abyssi TaxID=1340531 RepID=A0A917FU83_9BACL|nr:nucleotidyltransferase-like protein [Paenibacillus abyssi]GGG09334.1 hypothetical protein GCM10010916_27740 [Paenibacillus abyssi]